MIRTSFPHVYRPVETSRVVVVDGIKKEYFLILHRVDKIKLNKVTALLHLLILSGTQNKHDVLGALGRANREGLCDPL